MSSDRALLNLCLQQRGPGGDLHRVRQDAHERPQDRGDEGQDHSVRSGEELRRSHTVSGDRFEGSDIRL